MKKLLLAAVALVASLSLSAQITVGEQVASGTIGLVNNVYGGGYDSKLPPISLSYEYGLMEDAFEVPGLSIGVGGVFAYTSAKTLYTWGDDVYGWKYGSIILAAKGWAHYDVLGLFDMQVDNLDTYAALTLGYNIGTSKKWGDWYEGADTSTSSVSGLIYGFSIGARYWFMDNLAANLELGYGLATINLGVSYRF